MMYYKLNDLYQDYPPEDGLIYLCHQRQSRTFRVVESVEELSELIESTSDYDRCYYEIVPPNRACRIYYDFDYTTQDNDVEQLTEELILAVKQCILTNAVEKKYPIKEENLIITVSSGGNKVSVHLVITGVRVNNTTQAKYVAMSLIASLPSKYVEYVDHSVYKNNQQFRLLTCHKYLKDRVKMLWHGNCTTYKTLTDALRATMISVVSNSDHLIEVSTETANHQLVSSYEIDKTVVSAVMWSLREYEFSIRDIKGNMIILNRESPSNCPICHRVHEHEHPYVVITTSNVYFSCRRNQKWLNLGHPDLLVESYNGQVPEPTLPSNDEGVQLDSSNDGFSLQSLEMLIEQYR